jgi:hypothetical protein
MEATPFAQFGLAAEAVNWTGEVICEPLTGAVTVTAGAGVKSYTLLLAVPGGIL